MSDFTQLAVSKPEADCFEELISSAGNACTGNAAVDSGYDDCNSDGTLMMMMMMMVLWFCDVYCGTAEPQQSGAQYLLYTTQTVLDHHRR